MRVCVLVLVLLRCMCLRRQQQSAASAAQQLACKAVCQQKAALQPRWAVSISRAKQMPARLLLRGAEGLQRVQEAHSSLQAGLVSGRSKGVSGQWEERYSNTQRQACTAL